MLLEPRKEVPSGGQSSFVKGAMRHQTRSYKEALFMTMPNVVRKGDGGARGSVGGHGRREALSKLYGALSHSHGRSPAACQEAWEVRRMLLEVQGQLRLLQRGMAKILDVVGLFKVRDEKGDLKGKQKGTDDGPRKAQSEAQQKVNIGKGWAVWCRMSGPTRTKARQKGSTDSCPCDGAGPSKPRAHCNGPGIGASSSQPMAVSRCIESPSPVCHA